MIYICIGFLVVMYSWWTTLAILQFIDMKKRRMSMIHFRLLADHFIIHLALAIISAIIYTCIYFGGVIC